MNDCIFCKIVAGQIPAYRVWENDDFIAFLDIKPVVEGHALIIPREHHDYVFDLPENLYQGLFAAARTLAPAFKRATNCKKVAISIVGVDVPHTHLHLIPVTLPGDTDHSRAHEVSKEDLREIQDKLISEIKKEA